jgi:hypothetical protein
MPYVLYHTLQASAPGLHFSSHAHRIEARPPMDCAGVTGGPAAPDGTAVEVCGAYSGPSAFLREFFVQENGYGQGWWRCEATALWYDYRRNPVNTDTPSDPPAVLLALAALPRPSYTPPQDRS